MGVEQLVTKTLQDNLQKEIKKTTKTDEERGQRERKHERSGGKTKEGKGLSWRDCERSFLISCFYCLGLSWQSTMPFLCVCVLCVSVAVYRHNCLPVYRRTHTNIHLQH